MVGWGNRNPEETRSTQPHEENESKIFVAGWNWVGSQILGRVGIFRIGEDAVSFGTVPIFFALNIFIRVSEAPSRRVGNFLTATISLIGI